MSRDRRSLRADVPIFSAVLQAKRRPPLATCAVLIAVGWCTTRDGPQHVLRVERQGDGGSREAYEGSLRPSNVSGPSYRPTHPSGCPSVCARAAPGRGRGRPRAPSGPCALCTGASAGVHAHAPGRGHAPRGAWACGDAVRPRCQAPSAGWPPRAPGRRRAPLRPALLPGAMWPDRPPGPAALCQPRRGRMAGLSGVPRGPCQVFSPSGSASVGRPAEAGARAPPLQKTPPGERPGRSARRRCPSVAPPRPGRL